MNFKNLTYEKLRHDVEKLALTENDSYIEAYPEFLRYFSTLETIERHHLIISSHFVYGWMPTIIHLNIKEIDQILLLLNAVKSGQILNREEIQRLKYCINNSMVGLSKLLHFINPTDYAIWDSRIFKYITAKKSQYGIDKAENYLAYLENLKTIIAHKNYVELHKLIEKQFDYEISPMRAIEILMFETDRKFNNDSLLNQQT